MNHDVKRLMTIAENYTNQLDLPGFVCSFAGGSVGRGEADTYSDLDLNVYLEENLESYSENVLFQNEIIQLHVHSLPTLQDVEKRPWDFRFTREACTVWDPSGQFQAFQTKAVQYLDSPVGREKMFEQAKEVVERRKRWAAESLQAGNHYSAGVAGMAALTDAGFLHAYFTYGLLSSTGFMEAFRRSAYLFDEIRNVLPMTVELLRKKPDEILSKVSRYLRYLRQEAVDPESFELGEAQESLVKRKMERLRRFGDVIDLFFLFYGEMFWFYLSGSKEGTLEEHLKTLPEPIRKDLALFGFVGMTEREVETLCGLADQLVDQAKKGLGM